MNILSLISFLPFLMFIHLGNPIKCVSHFKSFYFEEKKTTCEGDQCVNFIKTNEGSLTSKGCLTGFNYTNGCVWDADHGVLCICNTNNCNSVQMKGNEGDEPLPMYNCQLFSYYPTETPDYETKEATGPFCKNEANQVLVDDKWKPYISGSTVNEWDSTCFDFPVSNMPSLDFKEFISPNAVYSFQFTNRSINYLKKCTGDMCNKDWDFNWAKPATDVTCSTGEPPEPCKGEFCILASEPDGPFEKERSFCMTANQTMAKKKYTVGIYGWKGVTYYICKENNCNKNLAAAKKSIEKYLKNDQEKPPPKAPVVESKPPKEEEKENSAGYCSYGVSLLVTWMVYFNRMSFTD